MGKMSNALREVCNILNYLIANGTKQEQDLAIRLVHEIEDEVCKGKWVDSTTVSHRLPPQH